MRADDHAQLMDDVYRHQRFIYDLTRKYYLFGRDELIARLDLKPGARVVEVGCGTARNLVKIGRRYPGAELFGLDASSEMLKTANQAVSRAGLAARTRLAQGYAEALSPALFGQTAAFDAVVFSYSLSMIPDWKQAVRAAFGALAPGGSVHIVDFADLKGLGPLAEQLLRRWLSLFHVAPRQELIEAFEADGPGPLRDRLRLLPGRYAFTVSLPTEAGRAFSLAVAGASQPPGKSENPLGGQAQ